MPLDAETQRRLALLLQQDANPSAYDETGQPMPATRSGIANLLMALREKVPENTTAEQHPLKPWTWSGANMLRGALEHGANSFDTAGLYRDPSQMTAFDAPMAGIIGTAPSRRMSMIGDGYPEPIGPLDPKRLHVPDAYPEPIGPRPPAYPHPIGPPKHDVMKLRARPDLVGEFGWMPEEGAVMFKGNLVPPYWPEIARNLERGVGDPERAAVARILSEPPPPKPEPMPRPPKPDIEAASAGRYDRVLRALNADKDLPSQLPASSRRLIDIELKKAGATTQAEKVAVIERLRKEGYLLGIPAAAVMGIGSGEGD